MSQAPFSVLWLNVIKYNLCIVYAVSVARNDSNGQALTQTLMQIAVKATLISYKIKFQIGLLTSLCGWKGVK